MVSTFPPKNLTLKIVNFLPNFEALYSPGYSQNLFAMHSLMKGQPIDSPQSSNPIQLELIEHIFPSKSAKYYCKKEKNYIKNELCFYGFKNHKIPIKLR
jgi:hypothetical protein